MTTELKLLLACARVVTSPQYEATIRQTLDAGIDWTSFAHKALNHGLAGLVGHALNCVAPDMVPDDILSALRALTEQTRKSNRVLVDDLAQLVEAQAKKKIEAIPIGGPVLAIRAYGDLGFRVCRDLDFLVRDSDLAPVIAALRSFGYERQGNLTSAQFELIHRNEGATILFKNSDRSALKLHTRLTSIKMALDIDYSGLWRRAQRTNLNGQSVLTLAPEDDLLSLAISGSQKMWWSIKWACDVAAVIASHPKLDWPAASERAHQQGSLRMLLLATSLARRYFNASVPDAIVAMELADSVIEQVARRVVAHWQADELTGLQRSETFLIDRLRLHIGLARRAQSVARSLILPGAQHVALVPLPKGLHFVYAPVRIVHDFIARPLWQAYRQVGALAVRIKDATTNSDFALAILPTSSETRLNIRRYQKICASAKRVLAENPSDAQAWYSLANALCGLKRYKQAIACYDKVLAVEPDNPLIWKNRGAAIAAIGTNRRLPSFERAPQDSKDWTIRAGDFCYSNRQEEAVAASDRALALDPENVAAARIGIHSRLLSCDWRRREYDKQRTTLGLRHGSLMIKAIDHRSLCDSEEELRMSAQLVARHMPPSAAPLWRGERYHHEKIRIAYISADLHIHPVANAIVGCFEEHDKARFHTTAISTGPGGESALRRRIEAAFDSFVDVKNMNSAYIAKVLRGMEIDVAIDLTGYAGASPTHILAHRPAPVQVNYLGYSGTVDVPFVDYIIADKVVIPPENQMHYSEKVVYLPHSYFPNDRKRPIAENTPSRIEVGLPQTGFVFACLNQSYKIGPEIFEIWMRLLQAVDGSVLWLKSTNRSAVVNLRREAQARGVAPERLVFAVRVSRTEDYLAQLRQADLFLDTLPYNAHATASDALWAGLPVLTCMGRSFSARVAASLLYAIGLPELVTSSLAEYEELARALAHDPERLSAIKAKLMRNRDSEPLFDTPRFTRYLEAAYTTMWQRQQAGSPPASFAVPS